MIDKTQNDEILKKERKIKIIRFETVDYFNSTVD